MPRVRRAGSRRPPPVCWNGRARVKPYKPFPLAVFLATLACSSQPLDDADGGSCAEAGVARQPFTRACPLPSLEPAIEETDPDYGRVSCWILSAWRAGSAECACDRPGFAPAAPEKRAVAIARFSESSSCTSACCEERCFCEFLQHAGDALAACQSRPSTGTYQGGPSGWCYVDPELGLGTEDISTCPRAIRYFPEEPRYDIDAVIACLGAP